MVALQKFTNLIELITYFKNEQVCRNYLAKIRWDGKVTCPYDGCGHNKVFKYKNGKNYKCYCCKKQFSVRVGTIFEGSKVSLKKCFSVIYLVTSHKKGISSTQLAKDIGVTQKTAWFILHRIRKALGLHQSDDKLDGICEADETYVGGLEKNKHWDKKIKGTQGRSTKTKTIIAGVRKVIHFAKLISLVKHYQKSKNILIDMIKKQNMKTNKKWYDEDNFKVNLNQLTNFFSKDSIFYRVLSPFTLFGKERALIPKGSVLEISSDGNKTIIY